MTSLRSIPSARRGAAALAAGALLLLLAASPAAALYAKPPGGAWTFRNLFDATRSGAFALTRDGGSVAKLTFVPGGREVERCGRAKIALVSRPKVLSYRSVSGRYAVARLRSGLFVPFAMRFKRPGGRPFTAKLMLLWDRTGRLVDTGKFQSGDCRLSFYATKR